MEIYEMVDHLKSVYLKKLQMLFNFISFVCVCEVHSNFLQVEKGYNYQKQVLVVVEIYHCGFNFLTLCIIYIIGVRMTQCISLALSKSWTMVLAGRVEDSMFNPAGKWESHKLTTTMSEDYIL